MSTATNYVRFTLSRRIEHVTMLTTISALALTGLPQKFPTSTVSGFVIRLFGGVETLRVIHHSFAVVLMLATAYHLLMVGYHAFVLRSKLTMLPGLQDAKDGAQALFYNVGIARTYPKMGRFNFEQKMEYWSFVWGTAVMILTGFIMLNPITATRFLPGEFVPAAKAAHGAEAVLAILAILLWHMYNVHVKRFNKAMWTGEVSAEEMEHEHPLELEDIKAGIADRRPDSATLRRRQRVYYPLAALLALLMLTGIYTYVTIEDTASSNIPPISQPAVSP